MTPQEFIAKWKRADLSERSGPGHVVGRCLEALGTVDETVRVRAMLESTQSAHDG